MLRTSLLGHLGADPEARYTDKGVTMTTFRVAVNQLRTDASGERDELTHWFRVRAMGRLGDQSKRLQKGTRVLVAGRLQISPYQTRDGEARLAFDIWADEVVNLSAGRAVGDEAEADLVGAGAAPRQSVSASDEELPADDDLPF
jgi:single-strand DNA-binding protein